MLFRSARPSHAVGRAWNRNGMKPRCRGKRGSISKINEPGPFESMDGEHCLRGFNNRDIRAQRQSKHHLRACGQDSRKQSAKISRTFRRFHAYGLIAKIPHTRRWRVTGYGRQVMGTSLYLREHHFPTTMPKLRHNVLRLMQRSHGKRIYSPKQNGPEGPSCFVRCVSCYARGSPCSLTVTVGPGGVVVCMRCSWPRNS